MDAMRHHCGQLPIANDHISGTHSVLYLIDTVAGNAQMPKKTVQVQLPAGPEVAWPCTQGQRLPTLLLEPKSKSKQTSFEEQGIKC